jgi:glucose-1-phosphate thymidylyltransferase
MKALVLSGGKGTRLRPITHTSAKQLVPIANKPILFYGLEAIARSGIREVGIVVGDTQREIRSAVGEGKKWGIQVTYIPQLAPLGLAHAVKISEPFLKKDSFVMYLGDNLLRDGIDGFVEEFKKKKPNALILLTPVAHPEQFGVAEISNGIVKNL